MLHYLYSFLVHITRWLKKGWWGRKKNCRNFAEILYKHFREKSSKIRIFGFGEKSQSWCVRANNPFQLNAGIGERGRGEKCWPEWFEDGLGFALHNKGQLYSTPPPPPNVPLGSSSFFIDHTGQHWSWKRAELCESRGGGRIVLKFIEQSSWDSVNTFICSYFWTVNVI